MPAMLYEVAVLVLLKRRWKVMLDLGTEVVAN